MIARPTPGARPATASWKPQSVLDRLLEHGGEGWTVIFHLAEDQKTVLDLFLRYGAKTWRMRGTYMPVFRPPTALTQTQSMTAAPGVTIWRQAATRVPHDLHTPSTGSNYTVPHIVLEKLKELSRCSTSPSTPYKPSPGVSPSSASDSSSLEWPLTGPSEVIGEP